MARAIEIEDGETVRILTADDAQGDVGVFSMEVQGNAVRTDHRRQYAHDGETHSAGMTHKIRNLRGQELYAHAFDGPASIRLSVAGADIEPQPTQEVTVLEGDVRVDSDLDSRIKDPDGVLVDPAKAELQEQMVDLLEEIAENTA